MIFPSIPIAQGLPKARADAFPVVPLEILGASTAPQQKPAISIHGQHGVTVTRCGVREIKKMGSSTAGSKRN